MMLQAVAPEHAARAFSVFRMGQNASQIGGAALGGALTAAVGPGWVLALDGACFLVAASLRFFLEAEQAPAPQGHSMLRDLREGWREFASRRWLWVVVAQFSVLVACIGAVESVYGPTVAKERLGGASDWGLAMAAYGVGLVVTGVLMARWRPRRILLVGNWGVFLFGVPALALAAEAPLPLLALAMFLSGVGVTVFGVNWMVALQQEIPEEMFSRVAAYDEPRLLLAVPDRHRAGRPGGHGARPLGRAVGLRRRLPGAQRGRAAGASGPPAGPQEHRRRTGGRRRAGGRAVSAPCAPRAPGRTQPLVRQVRPTR